MSLGISIRPETGGVIVVYYNLAATWVKTTTYPWPELAQNQPFLFGDGMIILIVFTDYESTILCLNFRKYIETEEINHPRYSLSLSPSLSFSLSFLKLV